MRAITSKAFDSKADQAGNVSGWPAKAELPLSTLTHNVGSMSTDPGTILVATHTFADTPGLDSLCNRTKNTELLF